MKKNIKSILSVIVILIASYVGYKGGHLTVDFFLNKAYTVEDVNKELANLSVKDVNLPDFMSDQIVEISAHMNDKHEVTFKVVFKDISVTSFNLDLARLSIGDNACKACEDYGKVMKRDDIVIIYQYYNTDRELVAELKYNKNGFINEKNEVENIILDKSELLKLVNENLSKLADTIKDNKENEYIEEVKFHINENYEIVYEETMKYGYYINDYNIVKNNIEKMAKHYCTYCNQTFQNDKSVFIARIYSSNKKLLKEYIYDVNGFVG